MNAGAAMPLARPAASDPPFTILTFDYGERRIGVAVGNSLTGTATPIATLTSAAGPDWRAIDALIAQWAPQALVVGMPVNPDGGRHPLADRVAAFVAELDARHGLPVQTVDERYTSAAAESGLRERRAHGGRRIRREEIDSMAAALIAETWLAGGTA